MIAAGVGPVGLNELQNKQNAAGEECRLKMSSEAMMDLCFGDSQLHVVEDKNANKLEQRSKDIAKAKVMKNNNAKHLFTQEDLVSPGPSSCEAAPRVQISCKDGEHYKLSTRSHVDQQANCSRSKVDLVHFPTNITTEDEGGDARDTDNKRFSLSESSSNFWRNGGEKFCPASSEVAGKENNVLGPSAAEVENQSSAGKLLPSEGKHQRLKHTSGQLKKEQNDFKVLDVNRENDPKIPDQGARSACLSLSMSPSTLKSPSISTSFPPWSIYAKAAPPWATNAFFSGSSFDRKMSYPTIQLSHTTAQPVLKMRRCATHVYIARYIQQRQQFLRQTFWPPGCHSGVAYNPSTLPANLQGKEQWGGNNVYLSSMQAGCVTLAESNGIRMPYSRSSGTGSSVHGVSVGGGTAATLGHTTACGTHGQYVHATTQQNGCSSLDMPSSKSPGQNAPTLDKSLYHAHSLPLELQSPAHQTSSPSHPPWYQQGPHSSPHVGSSPLLLTQTHSQLKHQGQREQQHHHMTIPSQFYGAGSDGFSGGKQMSNGKQSIQLHQQAQLQGQQAASPSDTLPSHRSKYGPKVKDMNLVAEKNDFLGVTCKDRATGHLVQSDLAASALAAKAHGGYDQLQSLGTQYQHSYQRSYPRVPETKSINSHYSQEQGSLVEGPSPIKQAGSSTDGSKSMESNLPVSVAMSACGGPAPIDQANVFSLNGQPPGSHNVQKQAMAFVKPITGADSAAGISVDNASAWGNLGKIPSSPRRAVSSSQIVVTTSHSELLNGSNSSSLSPGQQVWSNLHSATNFEPLNNFASRPSSGTFSLCAVPPSSSLIVAGSLGNNSVAEGIGPALLGDVSTKTATVGDPNLSPNLNPGEKLLSRVQAQPPGPGLGQTMFPQQQSMNLQQTRHQVYQQPQSNKQEQSGNQSQLQQQAWSTQAQQPSPQLQIQSFTIQQ